MSILNFMIYTISRLLPRINAVWKTFTIRYCATIEKNGPIAFVRIVKSKLMVWSRISEAVGLWEMLVSAHFNVESYNYNLNMCVVGARQKKGNTATSQTKKDRQIKSIWLFTTSWFHHPVRFLVMCDRLQ